MISRSERVATTAAGWDRVVALSAIAGGVLALASSMLLGAAFGFDITDVAPDLTVLPANRAGLVRWGALTDMLGFYLLSVPVALHLRHRLAGPDDPLMDLATVAGLMYACIGSIGAVIVATVVPPLLGDGGPQATTGLRLVRDVVFVGLWQTLETIPWSVWMLVVGARLRRASGLLGSTAMTIGGAAPVGAAARIAGIEALVGVPVALAIGLFPCWQLGLGLRIVRSGAS